MTKTDEKKLDAFLHKSLCRKFKIYWPMRVKNEVRARAGLIGDNKQASGKEEIDVVGPRPQNGPLLTSTNRSNMGA